VRLYDFVLDRLDAGVKGGGGELDCEEVGWARRRRRALSLLAVIAFLSS
jgi:hypothetical protein